MERNDYLIKKKFYAYLIPGVMMVAALQLGNLLDSIFVGNILGVKALAASSLGVPVVFLAQVPLMIIAAGGSTVAAVCIGRREIQKASTAFRFAFWGILIFYIANAAAGLLYAVPLANVLTSDPEMAEMAGIFMRAYMLGLPVIGLAFVMGRFMEVDNHPKESAAMHIIANIINLVLDYVFLQLLQTGIAGAVYSTIIGYAAAGMFFSIRYLKSEKRLLMIREKGKAQGLTAEIFKTGTASGMLMLMNALRILVLNAIVINMTGSGGMEIYAVSTNSMFLVQLCLNGLTGVLPAVGGVLFGDRDYYGVRQILKRSNRLSLIISLALTVFFILLPGLIGRMFGYTSASGTAEMELCIRLFALSFVFYAFNMVMQAYYPTIEKSFYATLNTILQGIALLLPVTLLLIPAMGVSGTGLASALTEAGTLLLLILLIRFRQRSGKEKGTDLTMLPAKEEGPYLDITVKGTVSDAAGIAHRIVEYCVSEGIERRIANNVAVAAEELVYNISEYSGLKEKNSFIDIRLTKADEALVLRVRDNGVFFDPLTYVRNTPLEENDLEIGGLRLILSLAKKVDYTRVLDMNNTIVEVAVNGR